VPRMFACQHAAYGLEHILGCEHRPRVTDAGNPDVRMPR
jgi:hypothetical protein